MRSTPGLQTGQWGKLTLRVNVSTGTVSEVVKSSNLGASSEGLEFIGVQDFVAGGQHNASSYSAPINPLPTRHPLHCFTCAPQLPTLSGTTSPPPGAPCRRRQGPVWLCL